jgi:hypothetical protein
MWMEGLSKLKHTMTSLGIKLITFRFVNFALVLTAFERSCLLPDFSFVTSSVLQ